jgi:hypothetical protein
LPHPYRLLKNPDILSLPRNLFLTGSGSGSPEDLEKKGFLLSQE